MHIFSFKAKERIKTEADLLRSEADMPLEDLLAKYEGLPPPPRLLKKNKKNVNSPFLKGKKESKFTAMGSVETEEACTSSSAVETSWTRDNKLANGHAENENNINREKEQNESNQKLNDQASVSEGVKSSDVTSPQDSVQQCVSSSSDGPCESGVSSTMESGDVKQEASETDCVSTSSSAQSSESLKSESDTDPMSDVNMSDSTTTNAEDKLVKSSGVSDEEVPEEPSSTKSEDSPGRGKGKGKGKGKSSSKSTSEDVCSSSSMDTSETDVGIF